MFSRLLAAVPLRANGWLGRGTALAAVAGWAIFAREFTYAFRSGLTHPPLHTPGWLMVTALLAVMPTALLGRAIAERDLESRVDTSHGIGRRWRWALALQFWGPWAYWVFAPHQLPAAGAALIEEEGARPATASEAAV